MKYMKKTRVAMLAATSLATMAAVSAASASDFAPEAAPTTVEAPAVVHAADMVDQAAPASKPVQRAALIAVMLGALGWLVKLIGPKKVLQAVEKTAEATVKVTAAAAKTAARAMRSPLRYIGWVAGLSVFALTGLWLFDVEWIGGLAAGVALASLFGLTALRVRSVLSLRPAYARARQRGEQN